MKFGVGGLKHPLPPVPLLRPGYGLVNSCIVISYTLYILLLLHPHTSSLTNTANVSAGKVYAGEGALIR